MKQHVENDDQRAIGEETMTRKLRSELAALRTQRANLDERALLASHVPPEIVDKMKAELDEKIADLELQLKSL